MDSIKRERAIAKANKELVRLKDFAMSHTLPGVLKIASDYRQKELRQILKDLKAGR